MITSFKGGVGKSTVAVNVAVGLSRQKYRTLIVDLDVASCSVDLLIGYESEDSNIYNFCDVATGKTNLAGAVISKNHNSEQYFYPDVIKSPFSYDSYNIDDILFENFMETAKAEYDFVIFDTPPGRFDFFDVLSKKADFVFVVTLHSAVSVRSAEKLSLFLSENDAQNVRLIINCFNPDGVIKGTHFGIVDIIEYSKIKLIGIIEYNQKFQDLQEMGKTAYDMKEKKMKSFFTDIVSRMLDNHVALNKTYNGRRTNKLYFRKK